MALVILGFHNWAVSIPNRQDQADNVAAVRFTPANFTPAGFAPLGLAGAWTVEIADPRFGGVSALAIDRGRLVALTDSGTVIAFPRPGDAGRAFVHDLPAGPGTAGFKRNRDSEALARDSSGRGWWVAFEQWNQLWLYDPGFRKGQLKIDLGRQRWRRNKGVEALIADAGELALFPETGKEWLSVRGRETRSYGLEQPFGFVSDAVRTSDGRLLLVTRRPGLAGLTKRLAVAEKGKDESLALRSLAMLDLGATDNVEAIAVEPRAGGTRLWLMTDNDFRARAPTYLVALDLP